MRESIDTSHPVFDAFRAVGYPPESLDDPGDVTESDLSGGDRRLIRYGSSGVEMFDVNADDVIDTGRDPPHDTSVEFVGSSRLPVGYAATGDADPANAEIRPMSQIRGMANAEVFAVGDRDPEPVEFDGEREAVETLDHWSSRGFVPVYTANAMLAAFGASDTMLDHSRDDPHCEGVDLVRAPSVAKRLAGLLGEAKSADSDIVGHKKTRRQTFSRNMDVLTEHVGLDDE